MYQYWGTPGGMTHLYNYSYDKLNRLLYGVMELTPSGTILNAEQGLSYDQMGNITQLVRTSTGTTQIDNLAYTYTGNQLQSVYDNTGSNSGLVAGTTNYTWDGNGNMLTDTNSVNMAQNKTVTYNLLNLPQLVKVHTGTVTYTYDATGNKLRKVSDLSGVTHTTDYIAGIEYDGATTDTLNFIQTEEGKAAKFGSIYDYVYYLGDHLGNSRVTFGTKTGSVVSYQTDDYYPFGLEINHTVTNPKNEYLYNKKELQEDLQEYDYGIRFYDPLIARFTTIDPYSDFFPSLTNYQYASNRPISGVDLNGLEFLPFGDFFIEDSGLVPRTVPIEELTKAGAEVRGEPIEESIEEPIQRGKFEWHHLIPESLKKLPFVRNAIRGGFKFEGEENKIELEKFSKTSGKGVHGNHPQYRGSIEDQIAETARENPNASPEEAAELLRKIANNARNLINNNPGVKINDLYKSLLLGVFPNEFRGYYLRPSNENTPEPPKHGPPPAPVPPPPPPAPNPPPLTSRLPIYSSGE